LYKERKIKTYKNMKKLLTLVVLLMTTISFGQTYIPFNGTGTLTSNGWTTHSGTPGQLSIITSSSDNGSSLSYPGLATSTGNRTSMIAGNTEDVNFPLTTPLSGVVYYSVLIKVLDATQLDPNTSTTGSYGLSLTSVASATTTAFQGRIYTRQGATSGFQVGILNNSGGTATPTFTSDLLVGSTHLLVVKYELSTNTASLFVNPVPGNTEPTATVTNSTGTTAAPTTITGFVIRQGGTATAGSGNVEIDEIRVSNTFLSVTPTGSLSTNQNQISGLQVYPNPTKNILNITTDLDSTKNIEIYDMVGKKVLVENTQSQLDVSSLVTGMYIVKITEDGKTSTKRLAIN
jgi:hypothetical protein